MLGHLAQLVGVPLKPGRVVLHKERHLRRVVVHTVGEPLGDRHRLSDSDRQRLATGHHGQKIERFVLAGMGVRERLGILDTMDPQQGKLASRVLPGDQEDDQLIAVPAGVREADAAPMDRATRVGPGVSSGSGDKLPKQIVRAK